eukprot:TRINITY_DN2789_c0_g1_i1.p1 TRINITY_DN2789_c0_g1~~TRINITY_DN2789_c0_g1_i1.p1  ORF type:complete len:536 (-),score=73.19 TRINITY_DN2789_c0_g1_i1:81-1688(-)
MDKMNRLMKLLSRLDADPASTEFCPDLRLALAMCLRRRRAQSSVCEVWIVLGGSKEMTPLFILTLLVFGTSYAQARPGSQSFPSNYSGLAQTIIDQALSDDYPDLSYMCDTFGPRYRGTPNLELALEWILDKMKSQGLENIQTEPVVNITNWVRGNEYLQMISPRVTNLSILGLGNSVGTGPDGIKAEVFVVSTFEELTANASMAKGKIVLFNAPFVNYGTTVAYRAGGASAAASVGALAALVRSITPFSLYTPHTGEMHYAPGIPQIPTAAVTIEDAEMMARMQARGQPVWVNLYMEAYTAPTTSSYNIIAELQGAELPEEVIVLGGHSDSWDVGTGCVDDGGGLFTSWHAVKLLSQLVQSGVIPRPKRTIRNVLWVDEEISQRGAITYYEDHISELANHVIAMESDGGNFETIGFGFSGTNEAYDIVSSIAETLLSPIGAGNMTFGNGADTDTGPLVQAGVPGASLTSSGFEVNGTAAHYFFYHHSNSDTFTAINMEGIKTSVAAFAVLTYVIADMDQRLPNSMNLSKPVTFN